jgi:hypothetical protein
MIEIDNKRKMIRHGTKLEREREKKESKRNGCKQHTTYYSRPLTTPLFSTHQAASTNTTKHHFLWWKEVKQAS